MATCSWVYPCCIRDGSKWLGMLPLCNGHYECALDEARQILLMNPPPKFRPWPQVVYYVTWPGHCETEVKIGTTRSLIQRVEALHRRGQPAEVLVAEPGDYLTEKRRHRQFATWRLRDQQNGTLTELFRRVPLLDEHMARLRAERPDWPVYAKL
jgi:hypothetical protein